MTVTTPTIAQRVAQAAHDFQIQLTGHAPKEVTAVLNKDTLVITLHGALTRAEQAIAASPAGAARVQEFHRLLFASSSASLLKEIERITGAKVREARSEFESADGTVVHAFADGTMVQVFRLAHAIPDDNPGQPDTNIH